MLIYVVGFIFVCVMSDYIFFFFCFCFFLFFFQAEDGIRDIGVTGVQTCALPILAAILIPPVPSSPVMLGRTIVGNQTGSLSHTPLWLNWAVTARCDIPLKKFNFFPNGLDAARFNSKHFQSVSLSKRIINQMSMLQSALLCIMLKRS